MRCTSRPSNADVNGDARVDVIAIVRTSPPAGGNSWAQWLVVLVAAAGQFDAVGDPVMVGAKAWRDAVFNGVGPDGTIAFVTSELAPGDPLCCPSLSGAAAYAVQEGRLVELP